jgi:hypothetical protein
MLCSVSVTVYSEWPMARYGKEIARPQAWWNTKHLEAVAK